MSCLVKSLTIGGYETGSQPRSGTLAKLVT